MTSKLYSKCGYNLSSLASQSKVYMLLFILIRPVWKHGPRSLVLVQVFEKLKFFYTGNLDRVHRVIVIVSRAVFLPSKSMYTGTRKMVTILVQG